MLAEEVNIFLSDEDTEHFLKKYFQMILLCLQNLILSYK